MRKFIRFDQRLIALTDVKVVDGTGAPAQEHRTVILKNGRIEAITDAAKAPPARAHLIGLAGRSVIPGLVGMNNHLMYTASINIYEDDKTPARILRHRAGIQRGDPYRHRERRALPGPAGPP